MNLEDRIKRRLIIDTERSDPRGAEHLIPYSEAARIAAFEAEDTVNPIAASAVVRKPLTLTFDEDAFRRATQEKTHG